MLFIYLSLVSAAKYCYYETTNCATTPLDGSFTSATDLVNKIKEVKKPTTVYVSGVPPTIKIKDLAGYAVTFVKETDTSKIKIDFQEKVDYIEAKTIKQVSFFGIPVIPEADPAATSLTLNGYAVLFDIKSTLEWTKDVECNIQEFSAMLRVVQQIKKIYNFRHFTINVEMDNTFDASFPIIEPLPYSVVEIQNNKDDLEIIFDSKKVTYGITDKKYQMTFKDSVNFTVTTNNKNCVISGKMNVDIIFSLVVKDNSIATIKPGDYNIEKIECDQGTLAFDLEKLDIARLQLNKATLQHINSKDLTIKVATFYVRDNTVVTNGKVNIESEEATFDGTNDVQVTLQFNNIKVNKMLKTLYPDSSASTNIKFPQLELSSSCVIEHSYIALQSTIINPEKIILPPNAKLNLIISAPSSVPIPKDTKIPIIMSPSLNSNIAVVKYIGTPKVNFQFKSEQNALATYIEGNTIGIQFLVEAIEPHQKFSYKCAAGEDYLSYSYWEKYDNPFTQSLEFVICDDVEDVVTLEFSNIKNKFDIILTDASTSTPSTVNLHVSFVNAKYENVKTFTVDCKITPRESSPDSKIKLMFDTFVIKKQISIDVFDFSGVKTLVSRDQFFTVFPELAKVVPLCIDVIKLEADNELTYFNDKITQSAPLQTIVPLEGNIYYNIIGAGKTLKVKRDPSLTSLPKINILTNVENIIFEGDWGDLKPILISDMLKISRSTVSIPTDVLPMNFVEAKNADINFAVHSLSAIPADATINQLIKFGGSLSISADNSVKSLSVSKIETQKADLTSETPNKVVVKEIDLNSGQLDMSNVNANRVVAGGTSRIFASGIGFVDQLDVDLQYDSSPSEIEVDLFFSVKKVSVHIPNTDKKFEDFDASMLDAAQSVFCSQFASCESMMGNISIEPSSSTMSNKKVTSTLKCISKIEGDRVVRCVAVQRAYGEGGSNNSLSGGAVAGIVIASVVVVGAAVGIPTVLYILKKKRSQIDFQNSPIP